MVSPGWSFSESAICFCAFAFAHETPSVAAVFRPLEEHMGGAHEWPAWLRDLVRMECRGRARVSLPVNLLGNVVPPIMSHKKPIGK